MSDGQLNKGVDYTQVNYPPSLEVKYASHLYQVCLIERNSLVFTILEWLQERIE